MKPPEGKILVVDDDPDIRELLGLVLGLEGFEIISVSTKQQALDMVPSLKELGVGGVLIDGNLSTSSTDGLDGAEINAAIKSAWGDDIKTGGISASDTIPGADNVRMSIGNLVLLLQEVSSELPRTKVRGFFAAACLGGLFDSQCTT